MVPTHGQEHEQFEPGGTGRRLQDPFRTAGRWENGAQIETRGWHADRHFGLPIAERQGEVGREETAIKSIEETIVVEITKNYRNFIE